LPARVTCKLYPKSKASRRTVPLPDFVIEALAEHLASFPAQLDELVFRNERGPLRRANFRQRVWLPALARSGLVERPKFHDLRHCYASWLISEGVPVNVQAVMGHEQASTTLNRYTHVPADTMPGCGAALNAPAACSPPGGIREPARTGSGGRRPAVMVGGRDRFRTCGLCRVKETRAPRPLSRPSVAPQHRSSTATATQVKWGRTRCHEASSLENLWQLPTHYPGQAGAVVAHPGGLRHQHPGVHGVVGRPRPAIPASRGAWLMPVPPRVSVIALRTADLARSTAFYVLDDSVAER
jgi:Phage integrase family